MTADGTAGEARSLNVELHPRVGILRVRSCANDLSGMQCVLHRIGGQECPEYQKLFSSLSQVQGYSAVLSVASGVLL